MPLSQQAIAAAVAVGYLAIALAGGGYEPELRAGATLAVWWAVIAGLGFGVWPRARIPLRACVAGAGLLAMAALSLLSIGWTADNGTAVAEAVRLAGYLGVFVLIVIAAPAASARLWLGGLAAGLVATSVLALGSRIAPSLFPAQDLVTFIPSVATRLSYPLNYWNGLGAVMAAAIVLLVWFGAHATRASRRAIAVAAIPFPALALFLTSSRGGVAALAVGLLTLLVAAPRRTRVLAAAAIGGVAGAALVVMANRREAFVDGRLDAPGAGTQGDEMLVALLVAAALAGVAHLALDRLLERVAVPRPAGAVLAAAAVVAGLFALGTADLGARIDDFKRPPADPGPSRGFVTRHLGSAEGSGRYQFWSAGLDAFESEPVRGIGAGAYEAWWAREGSLPYYIRDAHSLIVETLAELGILGLLALLVFAAGAAAGGVAARARDARAGPAAACGLALIACSGTSAAIDWTWELPAAFLPFVLGAAVLAGPALAPGRPGEPRFGLGMATLGAGWLAIVGAAIVLVAEVKLDDSREAARDGDLAAAESDADAARAVAPWAGAPRLQIALVRERRDDLDGALSAAREAAERDEDDWRVWLVVARLATRTGDIPAARRALARARDLNPRSPLFARGAP